MVLRGEARVTRPALTESLQQNLVGRHLRLVHEKINPVRWLCGNVINKRFAAENTTNTNLVHQFADRLIIIEINLGPLQSLAYV